jgi:hypothetical protein
MAITVTAQTLYDGPRRAKLQFTGISDGSGAVQLQPLIVASALAPIGAGVPCRRVKVARITGNTSYGNIELLWDGLVPPKFAELAGPNIQMDYTNITAIVPPPEFVEWTGNILYSALGFSTGSSFMLELELVKGR